MRGVSRALPLTELLSMNLSLRHGNKSSVCYYDRVVPCREAWVDGGSSAARYAFDGLTDLSRSPSPLPLLASPPLGVRSARM